MKIKTKDDKRVRIHLRQRKRISGTPERPRLSIFRSVTHIYAQVIDDLSGKTLASASTTEPALKGTFAKDVRGGNLKGAEAIARDLIKQSVLSSFRQTFPTSDFKRVIDYFEMGGTLKVADTDPTKSVLAQLQRVPSLMDHVTEASEGARVALAELILEGLYASDKIGRSEERGFMGVERRAAAQDLYRDYTMERNRNKKPLN